MELGAQFTCFTSTKVQILTHEVLLFSTLERREQVRGEQRHTQSTSSRGPPRAALLMPFFFFWKRSWAYLLICFLFLEVEPGAMLLMRKLARKLPLGS